MNKYNVALYLRLSDEDKDKKTNVSESIKNQKNMLLDEINKHENYLLYDIYCDEDLSGAGTYRPEFERLIKDCESGNIDIVLCKSQSRFSRDMEIIEKYLHNKFIEWNVRFISLSDNADTSNIGNKKARQINGLVNEWFLEDTSNNIRSAFLTKMKQGEFISPFAPFGYKINKYDNNKLEIDEYAACIVKKIFKLFLNGYSYTLIANTLNKESTPSPSYYKYQNGIKLNINSHKPRNEIKWSPNAIKHILTNEIYIGNLVQGKRTTISYKNHNIKNKDKKDWITCINTHSPIIDKITFFKVQKIIKNKTKPIKKTLKNHPFSQSVFCSNCNKAMRKKNSQKHCYLSCNNKECLNKSSIRYDDLEKIVLNKINNYIKLYYDNKQIKFKKINTSSLNQQLIENKTYLKKLFEDKIKLKITEEIFNNLSKLYLDKITSIKNKIKTIENSFQSNLNSKKFKHFPTLSKLIVNEFIEKIYIEKIDNQTTIKIFWNF